MTTYVREMKQDGTRRVLQVTDAADTRPQSGELVIKDVTQSGDRISGIVEAAPGWLIDLFFPDTDIELQPCTRPGFQYMLARK